MTQKYYKFLDGNMKSYYNEKFYYPTPTFNGKKWIPTKWIEEKDYEKSNYNCGKGLHLMKILNPIYKEYTGNCYEAEGKFLLGEDDNKARFRKIRLLKPVEKSEIFKEKVNLSKAILSEVDLSKTNLSKANLSKAHLVGANLFKVNLSRANLSGANLSRTDLSGADLSGANLSETNLFGAMYSNFTKGINQLTVEQLKNMIKI